MKAKSGNIRTIELDGILVPSAWSHGNRVTAMSIHSAGENEYLIDHSNKKGRELKKLAGRRVFVKGHLSPKKSIPRQLSVFSFKILEW